jgi:hypothetical protein
MDATAPGTYRPRGTSSLQRLLRANFPELLARHDPESAVRLGKYRQQRIAKAVERFVDCGDYSKGVARIKCTNAACKSGYFRPFSCKVFHLCPSCSQKRTLLFGEYMDERLLLRLPHRQIVFTFPKVLRPFFRHDHQLFGEVSRLAYCMIQDFYSAAAGRRIHGAAVIAYASAGDFVRWNPHLHGVFLEGGLDRQGRFVHLNRSLINERLARIVLGWTHSGFSLDMSVKIAAGCSRTREALAQYIARPPVSLSKMLAEEHENSVLYRSEYNPYFKTNARLFPALEFCCSRCGSPMKVLAVVTDPPEVRRILLHLIKTGVAPPGLEASALN